VPTAPPGERFIYSDINFFLLGDIVRRVSGQPLDRYAKTHVFDPLGMKDTGFLPAEALRTRIAPTERCRTLEWPCVPSTSVATAPERHGGSVEGRVRRCRSCAVSSTIRRRGAWGRGRPRRLVQHGRGPCRDSAACCSAAGVSTACVCFRPRRSR
jgi:CubicO group peptidase (beta-lactamase class C family)